MNVPFTQMHGIGNDFVVIDCLQPAAPFPSALQEASPRLCDRRFGVGGDGVLLVLPSRVASFAMRMFNPDGSEAEMCGNGLRCFVRWLVDRGEVPGGPSDGVVAVSDVVAVVAVETGAGVLPVEVGRDGRIAATMGPPSLRPAEVPLSAAAAAGQPATGPVLHLPLRLPQLVGHLSRRRPFHNLERTSTSKATDPLEETSFEAACVSMGNPHAVVFVPDVDAVPLEAVGPLLERHPFFPARTNVEFCQVMARDRLRVRVWERGAGITLACGTGACAAMVAARLRGDVGQRVAVNLPGGELEVEWTGTMETTDASAERDGRGRPDIAKAPVILRGPAEHVFDGEWLW